ncbi:MAG: DNA repair protein RecN [Polyangiaceae bacterium]
MLTLLRAKHFVLMDQLELELEPGLNVLTGETGAGKSIVVGALHWILGGKTSADQIRPGATEAEVEALFDVSSLPEGSALRERLRSIQPDPAAKAESELAIRRVVSSNGRSRAYVNGRLWTAAELADIAADLADVASQHDSVKLTDPATHLDHLDHFARLDAERMALASAVGEVEALAAEVRALVELEKTRGEREAFVRFMLQGIADVDPKPGELDALAQERRALRHAGRLVDLLERASSRLDGEDGITDGLARAAADLRAAAELDERLAELAPILESARSEIVDVAARVAEQLESTDRDPSRLPAIEERLYRLEGLIRQHGPSIEEVLDTRARLEGELESLSSAESRLADQERAIAERMPGLTERARKLTASRKAAANDLGAAISAELAGLGMGGARVLVEVEPLSPRGNDHALAVDGARLGRDGMDRVEFLIAPNKGMEPKPLRKIASGGELSRSLLALKRVLAESGPHGLYVFDEVDTGVGGAVAERIGAAIADVARHHQVLCITHVAPIAAFADAHFVVAKTATGDATTSTVTRVEGADRVREVARMMSGATITEATVRAATELIDASDAWKRAARTPPAKAGPAKPAPTKAPPAAPPVAAPTKAPTGGAPPKPKPKKR